MADIIRTELLSGLAALYQSRDWSDLVFFSQDGSRHPVHRAIVCPRSPYICAAVKERRWRGGVDGHLALPENDDVVRQLVEYFYHLDYYPDGPPIPSDLAHDSHEDHSTVSRDSHPLHPALNGLASETSTLSSIDTLSNRPEHIGHYGPTISHHHYSGSMPAVMTAFAGPISPPLQSSFHQHHLANPSPVSALSGTFSTRGAAAAPPDPWYSDGTPARPMKHVSTAPIEGSGAAPTTRKPVGRSATVAAGARTTGPSPARQASNQQVNHHHHLPPPEPSPLATASPYLVLHAKVFSAAVRYGIPGLRALALDKFKIQLTRHWDTPAFAASIPIVFAREREEEENDRHHPVVTSSSASASAPEDPAAAAANSALAHYQQHRELREAVADALGWHPRLLEKPEIEAAVLEIDGLAYELLKRSRRRVEGPEYE